VAEPVKTENSPEGRRIFSTTIRSPLRRIAEFRGFAAVEVVKVRKLGLREPIRRLSVVPCRLDSRTRHGPEAVAELYKRFPVETFVTAIRENIRLTEAPPFGQPVTGYDTKSTGAVDYRALAREVLTR
jgi:chromosome partitioning protein